MKFIRNLVSRKSQAEFDPASDVVDQVAAFEDVIGYGEEPFHTATPEPERMAEPEPESVSKPTKVAVQKKEQEPVAPAPDAFETAQNAYADAAFDESKDILDKLAAQLTEEPAAVPSSAEVKIWDIEEENDTDHDLPSLKQLSRAAIAPRDSASDVIAMFESEQEAQPGGQVMFPVGWLVVASGPGRGSSFPLEAGLSLIGRDPDQAVRLDFGDTSVARSNHAAVVYDPETHAFTLGHGGKKDIVRLNGKPVISNETLANGDAIRIGDTTLHFVPLCSDHFDWTEQDDAGEHAHVAIA